MSEQKLNNLFSVRKRSKNNSFINASLKKGKSKKRKAVNSSTFKYGSARKSSTLMDQKNEFLSPYDNHMRLKKVNKRSFSNFNFNFKN